MKKRIILVAPSIIDDCQEGEIPVGLISIGTLLKKKGYDAIVIRIKKKSIGKIDGFITKETLCVGISATTLQIPTALKLSKHIKSKFPWVKVIWGGVHCTLYPTQPLEDKSVDVSVFGDGEYTMLNVANALRKNESLDGINGCAYKKDNKITLNSPREPADISKLPINDFLIVDNLEKYIKNRAVEQGVSIHSANGCPFNCSFCFNTIKKTRSERTPSQILSEINFFQKRYNSPFFRINDELFLVNKERVKEFVKEKNRRKMNFTWETSGHVLFLKDEKFYSDKFLIKLRDAGLIKLSVGAESGSLEQLKRYRKNITPEDIIKTAKRMAKLKIKTKFSFMIGAPHETYEDMVETIKLIYKIKSISSDYALVYYPQVYRPYPGADLYNEAIKLGFKNKLHLKDWSKVSQLTGYTTYSDLPYLKENMGKMFDLLYYLKFIKFICSISLLKRGIKSKISEDIFCNRAAIEYGGYLIRKVLENKFIDKYLSQNIFKKSLINPK